LAIIPGRERRSATWLEGRGPWRNIWQALRVWTIVDRHGVVRILAVSGSLRAASSNRALLDVAAQLPVGQVEVSIYRELAALPPFNPDLDRDPAPPAVARFRTGLQACEAVLIASPEYAHGVPGVLKNALDWIVGSGELIDKPVAVISASARSRYAWASLVETLTTMSARVIGEASIAISLHGRTLEATKIAGDRVVTTALTSALQALAAASRDVRDD
jgi:NAD(P)H-dependent FMN reductase